MAAERLQKLIAAAGLASRREAELWITAGKVRVNGKIISDLGSKADLSTDTVLVNNKPLPKPQSVTYMVNKPKGVVCSRIRQKGETIITDLVPAFPRVYPVGRLDKESEGLILLTNDGDLTLRSTHPSFNHNKDYYLHVRWEKKVIEKPLEWVRDQLLKGVKLGDGKAKADKVSIKPGKGEDITLEMSVHEGRHHLLRRMCARLGLEVRFLRRTKFGTLSLGALKPGRFRLLTPEEEKSLA